jgi:hypothetical protein
MNWQIADDKSQMVGSERRRGEVTQFGRAKTDPPKAGSVSLGQS